MITYETLVLSADGFPDGVSVDSLLSEVAELEARCAHAYFVARHVKGMAWGALKRDMPKRFGLTNRQFSSVGYVVDGMAKGIAEGMETRRDMLAGRIKSAETEIGKLQKKCKASVEKDKKHREWRAKSKSVELEEERPPKLRKLPKALKGFRPDHAAADRRDWRFRIHQKKRYVGKLKNDLVALDADIKVEKVRLCFGGRKSFRAQYAPNADQAKWLAEWRRVRASSIFCIGSRDETYGSQTASWLGDGGLRLRIPPALEAKYGKHVVLRLKGFRRPGASAEIDRIAALASLREDGNMFLAPDLAKKLDGTLKLLPGAQALSWRLVRRKAKRGDVWVAMASFEQAPAEIVTDSRDGAWGLDFNPDLVAMARIDWRGNIVQRATFPLDLKDKTNDQIKAILGDAAAWAVELAEGYRVPLVAEKLDFSAKKATLRERGARYAAMLSSFAYAAFQALTDRRAAARGVAVRRVNPAFTTIIGVAKFVVGYALTSHHAAACAIARRGLGYSERIARRIARRGEDTGQSKVGSTIAVSRSTFPLPVRTRGKHVWSDWRRFAKQQGQVRRKAYTLVDEADGRWKKRRSDPVGYGGGNRPAVSRRR